MAVYIIGGGFAGCEAAWQLASRGIKVVLIDMKPERFSPAHVSSGLCELVCSNSFKSSDVNTASGLLKEEMRRIGSVVMKAADANKVPAGSALAVDRVLFSSYITGVLDDMPLVEIRRRVVSSVSEVISEPDTEALIIATGPLTDRALCDDITERLGTGALSFFDAAAPVVYKDSIDFGKAFFASRYGKGDSDYINCPMNREEYHAFYNELVGAQCAEVRDFDKGDVYEGCMPVEVMAGRGPDTLRYGPMKPVGIRNPSTGENYYAVVQLRRDDAADSMYNMVGFQTRLKFGEQKRVFGMIPGLENAEFARYGVMHKNTYIRSPGVLDATYEVSKTGFGDDVSVPVFFAGQITGVEGYIESASSGLVAGLNAYSKVSGAAGIIFPQSTQIGALAAYASGYGGPDFQPMGANFGIMIPDPAVSANAGKDKKKKKELISGGSLDILEHIKSDRSDIFESSIRQ